MSLFDGYVVNQEITNVIKIYPDFIRLYRYINPYSIKRFDYDERRTNYSEKTKIAVDPEELERKSLSRAKTAVMDMTLCNDFDQFATFTFKNDRQNIDAKKRQMAYWLNNQRILHGNFKYIVVPEFHKDGKSIHFHALLKGYNGNLVNSGIQQKGRDIHNITSFRNGFTTLVNIDDLEKVASYISKYLTKEMPKFKNKQRYWCSNGLKRPLKIVNPLLTAQDKLLFESVYLDKQKEILEYRGQLPDSEIARIADYGKRRYDDLSVAEW